MERRTFIVKAGALFSLPLIITEIGCDIYGDSDAVTAPAGDSSDSITINSTLNSGHTHSVSVSLANVDNPPTMDLTITTSRNSSHTHKITLTENDFVKLANMETIIVTSTTDSSHSHTFSIKVS